MGHPYHHALSSVRKWGGAADDYLPLHQWFDESKAITADFRHRALRRHAEGIFMLERFFGATITISTGRVVPVRLIGEQHVIEDLGFIPGFADWVRCIRPEPWMGPGSADPPPGRSFCVCHLTTFSPFIRSARLRVGLSLIWRSEMADYYTPTVVQPTIPYADMTPLEQLLLTQIFESESNDNGLYFFAEIMPADQFELRIETLRGALAASDGVVSQTATFVIDRLKDAGGDYADIELDLSATSWEFIFQDIVKRSATVDYVTVVSAFTCTRMRPDGFGGMAILITADAIMGKSTGDILADFPDQVEHGAAAATPGVGSHVLLSLSEEQVRAEIGRIIETDETLTTIATGAVTDADIRAGCLLAVERTDLREERDSAIYRAALAAIREAERREAAPA